MIKPDQTLAEDLECERLPDGAAALLPAGTHLEETSGPFITSRSDFFVLKADGVAYRCRHRPRLSSSATGSPAVTIQCDILTTDTPIEILEHLQKEIASAASAVLILEQVYITERGKRAMNRAAHGFFEVTSLALQRDTFLTLARLTDDATMGTHYNVSLQRLIAAMALAGKGGDLKPFREQLASVRHAAKGIRDWRDKYIAHNDLAEAFAQVPLSKISIVVVRDVLTRLGKLFESLSPIVSPGWSSDPSVVLLPGDGIKLLDVVEAGLPPHPDADDHE